MKFVYFIATFIIITSCSDANRSGYLSEVDQIISTIDSMEVVIDGLDFNPILSMMETSDEIEQKLMLLNIDTIPLELALEIDRCLHAISKGEVLMYNVELLKTQLLDNQELIESLKQDISEDNGHRERYEEYVQFEKEKVEELRVTLGGYTETMETVLDVNEESITSVIEILDERIAAIEVQ
ncbi:MAG: hypothetical protein QNK23_15735 [Crocinitomicaceae bacterium]|nr:hypothetical protein [Crocinitomicaceae bacterium]